MFGRVTIRLGIGPHPSSCMYCTVGFVSTKNTNYTCSVHFERLCETLCLSVELDAARSQSLVFVITSCFFCLSACLSACVCVSVCVCVCVCVCLCVCGC